MSCEVKENYGNIYLMQEKTANKANVLGLQKVARHFCNR